MKSLKEFIIKEGFIRQSGGMDVKAKIESWLEEQGIKKYTINADMTIDVGSVVLDDEYEEEQFPEYIQFRKVKYFIIEGSPKLKSLKGAPQKVGGYFKCCDCPKLESLEGAPQTVAKAFDCHSCENLTSLKGAPQKVGGWFGCNGCANLTSLEGAPKEVGGGFYCNDCPKLESLKGAPQKVGGEFNCSKCGKQFTEDDVKKVSNVHDKIIV